MKKPILMALLVFINSIVLAQNSAAEKHLYKAFDAIKNNDAEAFKSLWPDKKTFSEIIISGGDFDARKANRIEVYNESRYYRMMGKMLEEFLDIRVMNGEVNWQDLYIRQIYFDKNAAKNSEGIVEHNGFLWLGSNGNKAKNYTLPFADLVQFKGQWYGGLFRDVKTLDGSFEDFIRSEESGEAVSAEAETVSAEAAEVAMAAADSATVVELPQLQQTVFSTIINGKKMMLNWRVNGWKEHPVYSQTTYQYQNREEQSFAEIIALEDGYVVLVEEGRQHFFRIKNTYGRLSGSWFSTKTGKEIPLIFAGTEVKK